MRSWEGVSVYLQHQGLAAFQINGNIDYYLPL
jgi:hypothetical protein